MRRALQFIKAVKYLGLLGLPMLISDWYIWKLFWLFWLFGILEVLLTFPVTMQSLCQLAGMIYTPIKYRPLPDKDNFIPKIKYSLPFKGSWVAVNGGTAKETSHSWSINSQRYAYDFIILNEEGKSLSGSGTSVSDYFCYGKEILAPADGVVVEVKTDCKDSIVMGNGKADPLIKDIRGNYIIIRHADNEYSCLAHLKPESIVISKGQHVKRSQLIALCGNSGNTSEPHLHFQVQNGNSFFTSAGLPIHFENIEAISCPNYSKYDKRPLNDIDTDFISRGQSVNNI